MSEFRKCFDINSEILYLNNGTHSLLPRPVQQAITKYQLEYEQNPTAGLFNSWGHLWIVQQKLAQFFNADPKDLLLRTNVTEPLNEFILGQPLSAGDEILTSNQEYGAIWNICRFRAQKDGLKLRQFNLPNQHEVQSMRQEDYLDRVISALQPQTKMLVLSEVFTGHGLVLPIQQIAAETSKRNIILVVDGAHSPGFLDLDFSHYHNVDYYAGNLHKWFMGPKGTGFGWVNKKRHQELQPLQAGWGTYELAAPLTNFAEGDRYAISKLMLGCRDFSPFFALSETVDFWNQQGKKQIQAQIRKLGTQLIHLAESELGLFRFASLDSRTVGPLYSFRLPQKFQALDYAHIMKEILNRTQTQVAITAIDRELYMRLSPHIYTSEQDLTQAISGLKLYLL